MVKKTKIYIKIICILLISVFSTENVCHPADVHRVYAVNKENLAVPSPFTPPIVYTKITHDLEVRVQALAGIKLFLQGKSIPAVNGMLIEGYRDNPSVSGRIEFTNVRHEEEGMITALFKVKEFPDSVFEIKYNPHYMAGSSNFIDTDSIDDENILKRGDAGIIVSAGSLLESSIVTREELIGNLSDLDKSIFFEIEGLDHESDWEGSLDTLEVFLLIKDGEIIGYAEFDPKKEVSELHYMGVEEYERKSGGGSLLLDAYFKYLKEKGIESVIIKSKFDAKGFYERYFDLTGAKYDLKDSGISADFTVYDISGMRERFKDKDIPGTSRKDSITLRNVFQSDDKVVIRVKTGTADGGPDYNGSGAVRMSIPHLEKAYSLKGRWVEEALLLDEEQEYMPVYELAELLDMAFSYDETEASAAGWALMDSIVENSSSGNICGPAVEAFCRIAAERPHLFQQGYLSALGKVLANGPYKESPYILFYAALAIANSVRFSDEHSARPTTAIVTFLLEVLENSMLPDEVDSSVHGAAGLALIEIIKKYPGLIPEGTSGKIKTCSDTFSKKYIEGTEKNPGIYFSQQVLLKAVSLLDADPGPEDKGITSGVVPDMNVPFNNLVFIDDFGTAGQPLSKAEEKMMYRVERFMNIAGKNNANTIRGSTYITADHGRWGDISPKIPGANHFALMGAFCNSCIAIQAAEIIKKTVGEGGKDDVYITLPMRAVEMSTSEPVDALKYFVPDSFRYMDYDNSVVSFIYPFNTEKYLMWNLPVYEDTRILVLRDGEVRGEFINSKKEKNDPSIRTVVLNFLESEEAIESFLRAQEEIYLKSPGKYADITKNESDDEEYLLMRSKRVLKDTRKYIPYIIDSDKNGIDDLIEESGPDEKNGIMEELDRYIYERGGLSAVPARARYAFFKVLQSTKVLRKKINGLKALSDKSKEHLTLRMDILDKDIDFSDVAMAVFSGMVEDGEFGEFCETVQNKDPTYLPGAAEVLLIDSPGTGGDPSTGLYRIASFLSLFGMKARIIAPWEIPYIQDKPHIIGKRFITATIQADIKTAKDVKHMFPESFMVAGGQEAAVSDRILRLYSGIDCSIKRLGEDGMLDIVAGLTVKDGSITPESRERVLNTSEKIHTLSKPSVIKALSDLEFRVLFKSFNPNIVAGDVSKAAMNYILTTSHCPMNCIFCMSKSFMTHPARGRQKIVRVEVDDIVERLKRMRKYFPGGRKIYFSDDNFFDAQKRVKDFINRVKEEGLDTHFSFVFTARLDSLERMPQYLLTGLAEIGTDFITIGVESTIPRIVESIGKGGRLKSSMVENFGEIMSRIRKAGIKHPMAFMLLFTPDENLDDSLKIMDDISRIIAEDNITFSLSESLSIFPGTELFNMYLEGKVEADVVKMLPDDIDKPPILISADALPHDPENRRLIKRKKDRASVSSVVYKNNIEEEYEDLRIRVNEIVSDDSLSYAINTNLSTLYRIHINLLLIADMFLERRHKVLNMVDDLRRRRDLWLEEQLGSSVRTSTSERHNVRIEGGNWIRTWSREWREEISLLSEGNIHIPERFYLDLENRRNEESLVWKLRRAMEEILHNASQGADGAFWEVSEIGLNIYPSGKEIIIEIKDDGEGVPEETLREFQAWKRGEREGALGSSKGSQGKGIQTAYEHVRDIGGRMEIETSADPSSGLERGTVVRMIFAGEVEKREEKKEKEIMTEFKFPKLNMHIDLSVIPEEENQLEENMMTIALMIARNNKYGMDIRYILEGSRNGRAMELLRSDLEVLSDISGIDHGKMLENIQPPHEGGDVITIRLENAELVGAGRIIGDKEYIIALKPDEKGGGISIPNYTASSVLGLSLAALRNASDMVADNNMYKKDYDDLKGKILEKFRDIYYRYGVIPEAEAFSEEELEMMVAGSSATKLYYTLYYALPPAIKVTGEIHRYHEIMQDILMAA